MASGKSKQRGKSNRKIRRTRPKQKSAGQSKPVSTKQSKPSSAATKKLRAKPGKRKYTVKELSTRSNKTINSFLTDLRSNADEVDALKKPSEAWGAEIFGNKTYSFYGSITELASLLGSYRGLADEKPRDAFTSGVKVVAIEGHDFSKWIKEKRIQRKESRRRSIEQSKLDQKRDRADKRKLKKANAQIAKLKERIKKMSKKAPKKSKATKKR